LGGSTEGPPDANGGRLGEDEGDDEGNSDPATEPDKPDDGAAVG